MLDKIIKYFLEGKVATVFILLAWGIITVLIGRKIDSNPFDHLKDWVKLLLEQDDFWADITINLAFIGLSFQVIYLLIFKFSRGAIATLRKVFFYAAYSIEQYGHLYPIQLLVEFKATITIRETDLSIRSGDFAIMRGSVK